jgi:hypothetical protein
MMSAKTCPGPTEGSWSPDSRGREQGSNPRSPLGEELEYETRAKIGKSRPGPTAASRGLVRTVHQLPGSLAILRNLTAG